MIHSNEAPSPPVRLAELKAAYEELRTDRDRAGAELKRRFPQGFTGNEVPGEFEGVEAEFAQADYDLTRWLESEDGLEFVKLQDRAEESYFSCDDPDCQCDEPVFTEAMEALRFLAGRFKHAAVSESVAKSYAHDIDLILARLPGGAHPAPRAVGYRYRVAQTDEHRARPWEGPGINTVWNEPTPADGKTIQYQTLYDGPAAPPAAPTERDMVLALDWFRAYYTTENEHFGAITEALIAYEPPVAKTVNRSKQDAITIEAVLAKLSSAEQAVLFAGIDAHRAGSEPQAFSVGQRLLWDEDLFSVGQRVLFEGSDGTLYPATILAISATTYDALLDVGTEVVNGHGRFKPAPRVEPVL